ncbi:olfactory receptor 5B3-like [Eumetopias jubatus]|uniref:olfactory receptor 5B3-like n=1 Tax=Eumetopias jubatus TaxID=34886 RepID=UPI0010170563|nr:olfactory receptor 5B3-like [Eumetopias jubatus]
MENNTEMTEFISLGLTHAPELQIPLFIMFTLIYLITLVGNMGTILLILLDSHLHTSMYFFFSNLSLVDFCYSTAVIPKVTAGFLVGDKVISYSAYAAQRFFSVALATVENFLLASMAYDHFAAVCKPLHYTTTMMTGVCARLAMGSYICGFLSASIHIQDTVSLSFCVSNLIHHFFCDVPAVMALSCSDRHVSELVLVVVASFKIFFALIILISYLLIFITILKMHSAEGYQKALSPSASPLTTVSIFYGPTSCHSMDSDKIASVFYTMVILMLNPLVYSLRNKEVKTAFKEVVEKAKLSVGFTS